MYLHKFMFTSQKIIIYIYLHRVLVFLVEANGAPQNKRGSGDGIGVVDGSRVDQDGEVDKDVDLEHANPELESPLKLQ